MTLPLNKASNKKRSLFKRFLPLYIGYFLQCFVLWYSVEKIFMLQIGFNAQTITIGIALYSVVALLMEIPSGVLADRWSRKGTLALAGVFLAASSLFGGISNNVPLYLICYVFWGLYISMSSGCTESIVYDTLLEERGNARDYKVEYSKIDIVASIGLVSGAIVGGITGQLLSPRAAFLLTVPMAIASIFFMLKIKETKLHKELQNDSVLGHVKETLHGIFCKKQLLPILIPLLSVFIIYSIFDDVNQIYLAAFAAPVIIYGPFSALLYSYFGVGGVLSRFLKSKKRIHFCLIICVLSLLAVTLIKVLWVNIIAQFIVLFTTYGLSIAYTHHLHDNLPSKTRASSVSTVSAIQRLLVVPVVILFGYIANNSNPFSATWMLFAVIIVAAIFGLFIREKTAVTQA